MEGKPQTGFFLSEVIVFDTESHSILLDKMSSCIPYKYTIQGMNNRPTGCAQRVVVNKVPSG